MKRFLIKISGLFCLINSHCFAIEVPIYDFNLSPFSQVIEDYISPKADNYTKPLVNAAYQQAQLRRFYRHYYASDEQGLSPWSEAYVMTILPTIYQQESQLLAQFNNKDKAFSEKHYGENFKERDEHWWYNIQTNVDLENMSMLFQPDHMAITVANTFARALPEMAPDFYHASIPGQGFPFDNLQDSALWVGTPLYVLHTSKDKAWSLVLTPDGYSSWVKSTDIAYVSSDFIQQWQAQAQKKWAAVTATNVAVYDSTHHFLFSGYIGAVFPMVGQDKERITILIPRKNHQHQAVIKKGYLPTAFATRMPLSITPEHMAMILQPLHRRSYGWGGAFFLNDCSQEMKSIFTPFGIWIPRNTTQQMQMEPIEDLSDFNTEARIKTLQEKGHPFMTLIFIGGHVMLYIGTHVWDNQTVAMTYQNVWGLAPQTRDKRYVIGQSVFLPLLEQYPHHPDVVSLASRPLFQLLYLDQMSE